MFDSSIDDGPPNAERRAEAFNRMANRLIKEAERLEVRADQLWECADEIGVEPAVAAVFIDPSMAVILIAIGAVWSALSGDEF